VRYLVLMSDSIGDVESRARERAEMIRATFVDARRCHFIECECGEVLTFVDEASAMVM
jgi:hypothetical protein